MSKKLAALLITSLCVVFAISPVLADGDPTDPGATEGDPTDPFGVTMPATIGSAPDSFADSVVTVLIRHTWSVLWVVL